MDLKLKAWFRGCEQGSEIIKYWVDLEGVSNFLKSQSNFTNNEYIYYINRYNCTDYVHINSDLGVLLTKTSLEFKLPEKQFFIKGSKERGEEIIKLLESYGAENYFNYSGTSIWGIYTIENGIIRVHTKGSITGQYILKSGIELFLPENKTLKEVLIEISIRYKSL